MSKWKIIIEGLGPDDEETYLKYMECFINGETLDEIMKKLDMRFNFHNNTLHYLISIVK